jgi:alpha-tubulin suppressor-like RCC1 family protein
MATCLTSQIFKRELAEERIIDVAAGSSHFMILNDEGAVLSWGDNDNGQLGHGKGEKQGTPKKIESLSKIFINRISCGAAHSMAVTISGNAFVWGSNIRGQLGYDPKVCKYLPVPTKICLNLKASVDEELKVQITEELKDQITEEVQDIIMEEEEKAPTEHEIYEEEKKNIDLLDTVTHAVCGTWSSIFVTEVNKTRLHVWGGEEDIVNSSVVLYHNTEDANSIKYIKSRGDIVLYINKSGELHEYSIKNKMSKYVEKLPNL